MTVAVPRAAPDMALGAVMPLLADGRTDASRSHTARA